MTLLNKLIFALPIFLTYVEKHIEWAWNTLRGRRLDYLFYEVVTEKGEPVLIKVVRRSCPRYSKTYVDRHTTWTMFLISMRVSVHSLFMSGKPTCWVMDIYYYSRTNQERLLGERSNLIQVFDIEPIRSGDICVRQALIEPGVCINSEIPVARRTAYQIAFKEMTSLGLS